MDSTEPNIKDFNEQDPNPETTDQADSTPSDSSDDISEILGKLSLEPTRTIPIPKAVSEGLDYKNILLYKYSIDHTHYQEIIDLVAGKTGGIVDSGIITVNSIKYKLNIEFHVTNLYTGGKVNERCNELQPLVGKSYKISINNIGITDRFICLGITIQDSTDAYFGNPVKHITFALNNFDKKVFPKDSYTALLEDNVQPIDNFEVGSTFTVDLKK